MLSYLSRPLYGYAPMWTRMQASQLDEMRLDSAGEGLAVPWSPAGAVRRRGEWPVLLESRAAVAEALDFFEAAAGRRRGFWVPSWTGEYRLVGDADDGTFELTIEAIGLADLVAAGEQFRHLAIVRPQAWKGVADIEFHRIASIAVNGSTEVITLDGVLAEAVADYRNTLVTPLLFCRLSSDEIALQWESTDIAELTVAVTELPHEYDDAIDGAAPVFLYDFDLAGEHHRFADWGEAITYDSFEWAAASISHEDLVSDDALPDTPLRITAFSDDPESFLRTLTRLEPGEVSLEIVKYDVDAGTGETVWRGTVGGARAAGGPEIEIEGLDVLSASMQRQVPAPIYQRYDNRHVYDSGVSEAAFTTSTTIGAVDAAGGWIEAAAFGDKADAEADPDWFTFGRVRIDGRVFLCRKQDGDRLYLTGDLTGITAATAVDASAGYDRSIFQRRDKFSDLAAFVGFPWFPARNTKLEPMEGVDSEIPSPKK